MSPTLQDAERAKTPSLLRLIFFRSEHNKDVFLLTWIKILLIELLFGEEILENLVITSSYSNTEDLEKGLGVKDNGWSSQLCYHIPNGIINNFFKKQITEMIFVKFYRQYFIIETVDTNIPINVDNSIDISQTEFFVSKVRLHQFMELKKLYNFLGLSINFTIDAIVYLVTKRIELALLYGAIIELVRKVRF